MLAKTKTNKYSIDLDILLGYCICHIHL